MSQKLRRVAVVYHYFAHYRAPILMELSQTSKSRGWETILISDTRAESASLKVMQRDELNRCTKHIAVRNLWLLGRRLLWQHGLQKAVREADADVIVYLGSMYFVSTWFSALWARLCGKRVIFWTHGFLRIERTALGFVRAIFYRLADRVMVYGSRAVDLFDRMGLDANKVDVIFNSLDYSLQKKLRLEVEMLDVATVRDELLLPRRQHLLLFTGRLIEKFRLDLALEALSLIKHKLGATKVCLLVVGDGEARDKLENLVLNLDLQEDVVFFGAVYNEEVLSKMFRLATVSIIPERAGLSALHSLGYGVPVITNDDSDNQMPEAEAVIEGVTGWRYRKGSVEDLATKVERSLDLAESMYGSCVDLVEKYYCPAVQADRILRSLELSL